MILAEIRYRDADPKYLPEDSPWWRRQGGKPVMGWAEGGYVQLDFSNGGFRDQVALQARAVMQSGIFDGVMLDWWQDDDDRVALIKTVRDAIGSSALILVNSNQHTTPRSAEFVNGYYMECTNSQTAADWRQIGDTLGWAETHLRSPHMNCVETWLHHSREDLNLMRATTTLSLTLSDGYCLFCDPDPLPTPDHLHDWYDFWTRRLGRPIANGEIEPDGTHRRTFTHGTAVYNPMGNAAATLTFGQTRTRISSGESGIRFIVAPCDGDLFIQPEAK